jgi:hypothetical protein
MFRLYFDHLQELVYIYVYIIIFFLDFMILEDGTDTCNCVIILLLFGSFL